MIEHKIKVSILIILVTGLIGFQGTLLNTLREARPTIFLGVPRVWEKLMEGMQERGKHVKGLKRKIGEACKKAGLHFTIILQASFICSHIKATLNFSGSKFVFAYFWEILEKHLIANFKSIMVKG